MDEKINEQFNPQELIQTLFGYCMKNPKVVIGAGLGVTLLGFLLMFTQKKEVKQPTEQAR